VTENGKLLVNEMAPRPHNSGHHTIEANYTSQYEQHLRAILNFPLGSAEMIQPAVMLNLLGEPGFEGNVLVSGLDKALAEKGVFLHLYGKKTTKPYRKMGHITVLNSNLDEAKRIALLLKKNVKVISDSY
jgi:5-(carboxyamino)imidazole ribonucleotide synthase